jgi:methylene-fatty-acyl-phospholipid synthase
MFATTAFLLNLLRLFYFCLLTESEAIFDLNTVMSSLFGFFLLAIGQILNFLCYYRLGYLGIYYGVCFGIPIEWCTEFPYNKIQDPQYIGSTLSYLGYTIARGRLLGYSGIACLFVGLSYYLASRLESYLIPICLSEAEEHKVQQVVKKGK